MDFYNTKYVCCYNREDVFLESDDVNDSEREFIRNVLYKKDLLNIFNMNEDDEINYEFINDIIKKIYILIKEPTENSKLMEYIKKLACQYMIYDIEIGFTILFSFDYLYLIHPCICDFLKKGKITSDNLNNFKKNICI
jgi:hypothetical protein